jgi:HTH-type transcriptional regulator, sugar sensing transcriptional regulator
MKDTILEKIGLTNAESRVYLTLLRTGKSTIGTIIKEARVSNSKIYDILDRLNKKGLIGVVIENNKRTFEAKNPSRLKELIELRKKEIVEVEDILPELNRLRTFAEPLQEAEILQGLSGIKTFTEMILEKLNKGDTFYIMGAPKESNDILAPYLKEWHQRRVKKGVHCKILYNHDFSKEWINMRKKTPLTEVRILPKSIRTPVLVDISKNYVSTILFGDKPLCFVIKNKKIADSYISYFELLWKTSKKQNN